MGPTFPNKRGVETPEQKLWSDLGPDDAHRLSALREVVEVFYDKVFGDLMIGFLFEGKDRGRLIELEAAFVARMLGGAVPYPGRGMRRAHAASPILGGHFMRRQQLLREALDASTLPLAVREAWLAHNERLRPMVTQTFDRSCRAPEEA